MTNISNLDISTSELNSFLEKIWETYQVDFREYGKAHLKRRVRHRMTIAKHEKFDDLCEDVLKDKSAFLGLFKDFSINVTELFRDPDFYQQLYQILSVKSFGKKMKVWITACASGEEAYSFLMMLHHFGIPFDKIVASDFNPDIVQMASLGRIDSNRIPEYSKNLKKTGFEIDFNNYFDSFGTFYEMKEEYLNRIEFVTHNLIDEFSQDKFDLVSCRNVLIYFEKDLQNHVINNLSKSLEPEGLLCLGSKESLRFMTAYPDYTTVDQAQKIYQKK